EHNIVCYEADIRFVYRTIIDKNLLGSIEIEGDYTTDKYINRIYTEPKIKAATIEDPKLTVLSIDIETDMKAQDIYAIALYAKNYKEEKTIRHNFIVAKKAVNVPHTHHFATEKEMLQEMIEKIREIDPDIITGWNVVDFDFKVLRDKCKHHKILFILGRTDEETKVRIEAQFFKESSVGIVGRQVLDGIALLKNSFIKLDDYKLDTAAKVIIGKKKALDFSSNNTENKHKLGKGAQIEELFKHDPLTLVKYNEKDAELVLEILEAKDLINLVIQRSMLTGMQIDRVNASIASLDSLYLREARKRGYVCQGSAYSEGEERIKGGFVRESMPGIYDYIIVCDFKSLYPSIIRTYNIDPLSFQKDGTIVAPNGAKFRNEDGILPLLIQRLWEQRDEAKKKKDAVASYAIKITMNSFYGVL
ncbi:MAG: 3'-5' exonuclease, partial [Nanoarchaeota archaeon]